MIRLIPTILIAISILASYIPLNAQLTDGSDLFVVSVNGKRGFIDRSGRVVIEPKFDQASDFTGGIARVWMDCSPCTRRYINPKGEFVRSLILDEGPQLEFSEGLAAVRVGTIVEGRYGFINSRGDLEIPPRYRSTFRFSEGLAAVMIENGRTGYIDKSGKFAIEPTLDNAWDFQEGLARATRGGKWGFINKKGIFVIAPQFDDVSDFYEGRAMIRVNQKRGFIDREGNIVVKPIYSDCYEFSNGLAYVSFGKKYGFIDRNGKMVIPMIYEKVSSFSEGLAAVSRGNGKGFGYIDTNGKVSIPFQFSSAESFSRGLAEVSVGLSNQTKIGYIEKTGKFIWQRTFD